MAVPGFSQLLEIPGAERLYAFGSRTKGTATAASDLDLALIGKIDKLDPVTLQIVKKAQNYAELVGIGYGKGLRALDITVGESVSAFVKAFKSNPEFDPAQGVPKLKRLR